MGHLVGERTRTRQERDDPFDICTLRPLLSSSASPDDTNPLLLTANHFASLGTSLFCAFLFLP